MKTEINFMEVLDGIKGLVEKHGEEQAHKVFECISALNDLMNVKTDAKTRYIATEFIIDLFRKTN